MYLGLDIGSSSSKVVLLGEAGEICLLYTSDAADE